MGRLSVMKMATVLQNLFMFMLPAVAVAAMTSGSPFRFLKLDRLPSFVSVVGMAVIYVSMTPAMNWIVAWNESVALPESMASLERWMRTREDLAQAATLQLLDTSTLPNLLFSVFYIGILTGLGEEMFFRGALQRIFYGGTAKKHIAVWLAAFVFSALHFQFYGFVPRMLLGAFFGYMFLWSGSLWVPAIGHMLNNSTVVLFAYFERTGMADSGLATVGTASGFPYLAVASFAVTVLLMFVYRKMIAEDAGHGTE